MFRVEVEAVTVAELDQLVAWLRGEWCIRVRRVDRGRYNLIFKGRKSPAKARNAGTR